MARGGRRREPTFEDDGELRAEKRATRSRKAPVEDDDPPPRRSAKAKRSRSLLGGLVYWSLVAALWGAIGGGGALVYYGSKLPPIDQLTVPKRPPNIAILDSAGELVANRGDTGGATVKIGDLPPWLPKAFVAIEDHRFYSHWGVDPFGIARALTRNIVGRGGMQGGSTLTQQLAKNLFLTQERTLSRKIQEAILALWLEHKYSKNQILELYLNRVYFGSGAYGVEAAAQAYYGHPARNVTLAEAAVLAGLMKAPSKLAPDRNPKGATERAGQVIAAMKQEGFITEGMAKQAIAAPARVARSQGSGSGNYAADYVMDMLDSTIGAIDQDIVVTTTLDHRLQGAAERALTETLDRKGAKYDVSQGAVVAMAPDGAIRALVGGRNYDDSQFNRAVTAHRQPGSSFKPFVYLAGLEHGLTPDTVREDGPLDIKGWRPENYSREYFGPVTLTKALSLSLNTVAARVGMEAGPKNVARVAHRLGIQSELQATPSLALGTSEVTPLELVTAYAPFANGGIGAAHYIIARVKTADGKLLYQRKTPAGGRVIDAAHVAMMNDMMEETLLTGTARKAELAGWQAAGKTGTSQEFRDAWFVGYTSHLVAGVWLGNDDSSPTKKASGGNLPVEIWSRFMTAAHKGVPVADLPGGDWREQAPVATVGLGPLDDLIGAISRSVSPVAEPPPRQARAAPPKPRPAPAPRPAVQDDGDDEDQDTATASPGAPVPPAPIKASPLPPLPPRRAAPAITPAPVPVPAADRRDADDLVPPADIPTHSTAPAQLKPKAGKRAAREEKGLLEELFRR